MPGPESETIVRKVEDILSTVDEAPQEQETTSEVTETVFHGTSLENARRILEEGFKLAPHPGKANLGPIGWFGTDIELAKLYGLETRARDDQGMLTVQPGRNPGSSAPSYSVVMEAEIPRSSDPRGLSAIENGIEYIGQTRIVTELGMGNVAIKAMKLFEHKPTADGMLSASGRLIDEYTFEPDKSLLKRMQEKIRRKKNEIMGRPTL